MFMKRYLLATAMLVGPVVAGHAQDLAASGKTATPNAAPFQVPAQVARPQSFDAAEVRRVEQTAGPSVKASGTPWTLDRSKPTTDADATDAKAPESEIDLSALRYYAAQNDLARVSAEIRLLRTKHPNWEPPQDLFSEVHSSVPEAPLWALFAKRDMPGLHAAMDDIRQSNPDWQPSSDLGNKIRMYEAHESLVQASDAQQWDMVADLAAANSLMMTCSDVDALWRTAEALSHLNDEPHAIEAYRYILTNCNKPDERLATVQKASALLTTPGALDSLMALGRRGRDGRNEFDVVKYDAVRRRIGEASAGKDGVQPSPKDLETIALAYGQSKQPADAQLLGWYAYSQKSYAEAERWFKLGLAGAKPDAKSAEGMVLSLRGDAKMQDALDTATQYKGLGPLNAKLFIEVVSALVLDPKATAVPTAAQLDAYRVAIDSEKSGDGAQAYGWYLYAKKDVTGAEPYFKKAMDWKPSEDAAVGLMICAKQLHHDRDYAQLVAKYRTTYSRVAQLETVMRGSGGGRAVRVAGGGHKAARRQGPGGGGWDSNADAIVASFKAGNYDSTLAMLDARKGGKGEPEGLSVVRGWAQYHRGDWDGAQRTFTALEQHNPSSSAETGLRVIQEGYLPKQFR